jgi:acetyl-CoA acetyltransferase family protein
MSHLYIVEGKRTPFCKMGTLLAEESPASLGVAASKGVLTESALDLDLVDEVIFGCVGQPADQMNVSRIIGVRAGIPQRVPAVTVHRNCASGFEAITSACEKASAGKGNIFLVGGTESMSQMPLLCSRSTSKKFFTLFGSKSIKSKVASLLKFRPSDLMPKVSLRMGLDDPLSGINMGETAELLARELGISRKAQDIYSFLSHGKAMLARNKMAEEISPLYASNDNCINSPSGIVVKEDNGIRKDSTIEKLNRLRPIFDAREGTVTAGNSSQVTDGAVALLLMTEEALNKTGYSPIAKITNYAYSGCDPKRMGLGPVSAINKLRVDIKNIDLIEINEAFAAQVLACKKLIEETTGEIPDEKLNINGGAIALGHPVGASGARIVLTLSKELKRQGLKRGLASLCVGGGQGAAIELEACR